MRFKITNIPWEKMPGQDSMSLMARLSRNAVSTQYPLGSLHAPSVSHSRYLDRERLADLLGSSNAGFRNPLSSETLASLRSTGRLVVSGQQPGLLTGPLYSFLKAASVVSLSNTLSARTNCPHFPVFWIASEDHDVLEVNRVVVNGQRFVAEYFGQLSSGRTPEVGRISLEMYHESLMEFLSNQLPDTEFKPWVIDAVETADWSSYATMFATLMARIFENHPLIFLDPRQIRPLSAQPLADLIARWPAVTKAFRAGSNLVAESGFTPLLDQVNLFENTCEGRVRCPSLPDGFELSGGKASFEETANRIRGNPIQFSPSAGLRPILQDAVLPVAVYLGGPAELQYLWQIDPVYSEISVQRSGLYPRISATFVEPAIARVALKADLSLEALLDIRDIRARTQPDPDGFPESLDLKKQSSQLLDLLKRINARIQESWAAKAEQSIEYQLTKLTDRLAKLHDLQFTEKMKRMNRIETAILPSGKPQERVVNVLEFLCRYGPEFVDRTVESLQPGLFHSIVEITHG